MFGESDELIITLVAALIAAGSFAAFALPFLNRTEKKDRYRSVIEKRRKDLFAATRDGSIHHKKKDESMSAQESMAIMFKVQEMTGKMGEKIRDQMLQAGYRNPKAPMKFMIGKILVPLFLTAIAMLLLSEMEDMSNLTQLLILFAAALFGFKLPNILIKNQIQKRQQEINLSFPDSLDMMLICVQGGIGLEQTVARVADEIADHSEILAEELGILSAEMAMLNDRRQALQDLHRIREFIAVEVNDGTPHAFAEDESKERPTARGYFHDPRHHTAEFSQNGRGRCIGPALPAGNARGGTGL